MKDWNSRKHKAIIRLIPSPVRGTGRGSILIQAGNHPYDTQGCILVGINTKAGKVLNSRACPALLVNQICKALYIGEEVKIKIS